MALAIQAWLIKPYQIPSESMEPTLDVGQRVLVNRFIYDFKDPQVGDIVVFHPPAGSEEPSGAQCGVSKPLTEPCPQPTPGQSGETFIKRIVAGSYPIWGPTGLIAFQGCPGAPGTPGGGPPMIGGPPIG